jgi:hypothetical protein
MQDKIGKFEILSLLGQGAMGKVFLGRGGGNRIQDSLLRASGDGGVVKVAPVK